MTHLNTILLDTALKSCYCCWIAVAAVTAESSMPATGCSLCCIYYDPYTIICNLEGQPKL
jgi:hypothetical protein